MNVKIGKNNYVVDLENGKVKNKNGGLLRKQEKIQKILDTAKQLKERRERILKK